MSKIVAPSLAISAQNRHLTKPAYREEFKGDTARRTAAYIDVREDLSTGSTSKLPLEAKFGKISNSSDTIFYNIVGNFVPPEWYNGTQKLDY